MATFTHAHGSVYRGRVLISDKQGRTLLDLFQRQLDEAHRIGDAAWAREVATLGVELIVARLLAAQVRRHLHA